MADAYARRLLKVVVAQLSQAIGWHSIQTTPLELMTDITTRYMEELGKLMHRYAEQFGHSEPNLDDVGLSFRDMGISLHELEEYIRNVDCVACSFEVPKFPICRESHLNFLKPGSREVVTRPVHVHEHLPPMHPEMEEDDYSNKQAPLSVDIAPTPGSSSPLTSPKAAVFKRPGDPVSGESPALKRARLVLEEEGRPLREISSVMMTTSGFLSPAREGKLPESRTPLQPSDSRSNSPQPSSYPMVPPEVKGEKKYKKGPLKKAADGAKRLDKENKKKEHKSKGLAVDRATAERALTDEARVKKLVSMKELSKLKALKPGALKLMAGASSSGKTKTGKGSLKGASAAGIKGVAKAAAAAAAQVKAAAALLRPPTQPSERPKDPDVVEGKLLAEPDRQKLNIFKKISKVKEDKTEKVERGDPFDTPQRDSRESSPGLVIDESEVNNRQRDTRMAQIDDCIDAVIQRSMEVDLLAKSKATSGPVLSESPKSQLNPQDAYHAEPQVDPSNDVYMFDDDLFPPGTPSTPKTPELPISVSKTEKNPEAKELKEKRKKKDKSKSKKELKKTKGSTSPKKLKVDSTDTRKAKSEVADEESPDWPKTPEGPEPSECASAPVFPFFPHYQPAPGLIPPPIAHPLFQRFPLPIGKNVPHPAMPNLPLPPPLFMQPRTEDPPGERAEAVRGNEAHDRDGDHSPEKRESAPPAAAVARPRDRPRDKEENAVLTTLPPLPLLEKKPSEKKLKEHKKEKKDKEKAKKKKERKEKLKNKEKEEKRKIKAEKKEKDKEKNKEKKEKKDKKKDKERDEKTEGGVPKITFKLGPASPRPPTPDATLRKIVIKPVLKKASPASDEEGGSSPAATSSSGAAAAAASAEHPVVPAPSRREPSPELARISALVTRPPRQKASSKTSFLKQESSADSFPTSSQPSVPCASVISTTSTSLPPPPTTPSPVSAPDSFPSAAAAAPGPAASSTATAVGAASSTAAAATAAAASAKPKKALKPHSKIRAKEGAKKGGSDVEASREPIAFYFDDDGKQVWICPGCGGQDDGSPMIGCDDCDAWYHWVCVGIQVPPDENEDWYCRVCIVKKQENIIDKKKKSRKRKMMT